MTVENQQSDIPPELTDMEFPPGAGDAPPSEDRQQELQERRSQWSHMTDEQKLDYLLDISLNNSNNVQWLCTQLYSMLKAAERMPFLGKAFMKGM